MLYFHGGGQAYKCYYSSSGKQGELSDDCVLCSRWHINYKQGKLLCRHGYRYPVRTADHVDVSASMHISFGSHYFQSIIP